MSRLSVLFVVSECVPFAKTGGLADVAAALPVALAARGHDVRVVMPRYRCTRAQPTQRLADPLAVDMGGDTRWCAVHRGVLDDTVPVYLLEHDVLYDRDGIYGDAHGSFGDNAVRFALLCRGALALRDQLRFEPDLIHVHDWQSSLLPVLLAAKKEPLATVLTIHNLGYQGVFDAGTAPALGLTPATLSAQDVEHFGTLNLLKGGITHATCISAVSPRYASEIRTPAGGAGLDGVLRGRGDALVGILNGIDDRLWNPQTDAFLPARYDAHNLANKALCKDALQHEFGLERRSDVPVIGMVSRFAPQKGIDVVAEALAKLLTLDLQFAVVGAGEPWAEAFFRELSLTTANLRAHVGYDERLSHLVEAGADFFLMPSRYEPCGLNQLYSQRYGTPPIVRAVGGLMDTVTLGVDGFVFQDLSAAALSGAVVHAIDSYRQRPAAYRSIQQNGMRKRLGWDQAASAYEALYRLAMSRALGSSPAYSLHEQAT